MSTRNFKFLCWNTHLVLTYPFDWHLTFLSRKKAVFVADQIAIGNIIYMLQTFNDWICHGIFFKAKQIKLRWVKICSSPGILLWLSNVNQKNWDIVQILIHVLGPVRYGREEKINNWTFALSLSVWVISLWQLKMVPKKVWNSLSVM